MERLAFFFFVYFSVRRTKGARKTNVGLGHPGQVTLVEGKTEYWRQMGSHRQRGGEPVCYCCGVCSNGEAGERLRRGGRALRRRGWSLMKGVLILDSWMGFSYWGAALWPFQRPRILTTRPLLLHSARREEQQIKDDVIRKWFHTNGVKRRNVICTGYQFKRFVLLNHKETVKYSLW